MAAWSSLVHRSMIGRHLEKLGFYLAILELLRNHVSRSSVRGLSCGHRCASECDQADCPEVAFHQITPKLPLIGWQDARRIQALKE
jgi:hypothetical protein